MSDAPFSSSIVAIVSLVVVLAAIEAVAPHAPRPRPDGRLRTNLTLTVLTFALQLVLGIAVAVPLAHFGTPLGLLGRLGVSRIPAAAISMLVLDGSTYAAHRLMHAIPALWRFHRVHHADAFVDVTTTYRFHPLEAAWRFAWTFGPALVLGVEPTVFVVYRLLSAFNGMLEHANVRIPRALDACITLAWVTPRMHKLHHSVDARDADTNYGNLLTIFDRVLGTFTPSERADGVVYGLGGPEHDAPSSLAAMLRWPFARRPGRSETIQAR
jgi:sterol desaturase/sphingolipid hydroxylase (fatty acid hydroxylase superfamily)